MIPHSLAPVTNRSPDTWTLRVCVLEDLHGNGNGERFAPVWFSDGASAQRWATVMLTHLRDNDALVPGGALLADVVDPSGTTASHGYVCDPGDPVEWAP